MDLEDEITSILAKEISKEIDTEIMTEIYGTFGWTRVDLKLDQVFDHEVIDWIENKANCKGNHFRGLNCFMFQYIDDANWFKLRWE